jgi:cell division transport system ATP-binding protein
VDGEDLTLMGAGETQAYRRHVGFVFQDFKLIDRMTVAENTAFVLRVMGEAETVQRRRAEQALKWVGLEDRLDAYPSELSGGEQQRVAIARALINRPMMILADEPTGNLDPDLALEIMNLFREINAAGTTVLVATHDRELIRQVGCRAIMLDQGVIVEETLAVGDVSTYLMPSGATDEDAYERSASSDTAEWGSVDQVGPLGLVEAPETVTDDWVATELHDALEGVAEQPLIPGIDGASEVAPESEPREVVDGGATTEDEADKLADTDVFAALDAAFAGSEPAVPGDIGESRRKRVRPDETG